jgi:hypothetical protein
VGRAVVLAALLAATIAPACGDGSAGGPDEPMPSPSADPTTVVVPTHSSGAVRITFVAADPAPGSTVPGCGAMIAGCAGRLRMTFRLLSDAGGPVLYLRVFLHSTSLTACLLTSTGPFDLRAGEPATVDLTFDRWDACRTPVTIATMAAALEGPTPIASRQEWALRYTFAP